MRNEGIRHTKNYEYKIFYQGISTYKWMKRKVHVGTVNKHTRVQNFEPWYLMHKSHIVFEGSFFQHFSFTMEDVKCALSTEL
jgi:hypothetical protein